jgi:hypothetical protein
MCITLRAKLACEHPDTRHPDIVKCFTPNSRSDGCVFYGRLKMTGRLDLIIYGPEHKQRDDGIEDSKMYVEMDGDRAKLEFKHEDFDTICWNCRAEDLRRPEQDQKYGVEKPYTLGPNNKLYVWDRLPVSTAEEVVWTGRI